MDRLALTAKSESGKFSDFHESLELSNNPRNVGGKVIKGGENFLELEWPDVAEKYLKGFIGILVHFHWRFVFRPKSGYLKHCGSGWNSDCYRWSRIDGQEHMLVYNVQFVQGPNQVSVPILEKFEGLEKIRQIIGGRFYSPAYPFETDSVISNREFGVAVLCAAVESAKFPVRMIESGAQVVDRIRSNQSEIDWKLLAQVDDNRLIPSFSIFVNGSTVRIVLSEDTDGLFQIGDVMFGPFNF